MEEQQSLFSHPPLQREDQDIVVESLKVLLGEITPHQLGDVFLFVVSFR